jgi:glyoxylase-like metal-dependent hydrolase (beta-lactamase superfamily II)
MLKRIALGSAAMLVATLALAITSQAFAAMPTFETKKITDNVYLFRYQFHQAIFVVSPDGVIATDPIAFLRPQAATTYIQEIRKITQAPIKWVIYSHHHYDHIAGGKPFKDAGATFIAHRNAKAHLEKLKNPDVVIPDLVIDDRYAIELGGVRVELYYTGRNHSDNSLVVLVPKTRSCSPWTSCPSSRSCSGTVPTASSPTGSTPLTACWP